MQKTKRTLKKLFVRDYNNLIGRFKNKNEPVFLLNQKNITIDMFCRF